MKYNPALRLELQEERGFLCEWCWSRPWGQLHHALYRRDKRFQVLNQKINLMCVCPQCHMSGAVDTREARILFALLQLERNYPVEQWISSLPFKTPDDFMRIACDLQHLFQIQQVPLGSLVKRVAQFV